MTKQHRLLLGVLLWAMAAAVLVFRYIDVTEARGPFYYPENQDPTFSYLSDGIAYATGQPGGFFHHPGTPLSMLTGMVIAAHALGHVELFSPANSLAVGRWAYTNSELIFSSTMSLMVCLILAAMLVFVRAHIRMGWRLWGIGLFLLWLCGNTFLFQELTRLNPELLMLPVCLLLLCWLPASLSTSAHPHRLAPVCAIAVLVGLGMSLKLSFLPMLCCALCIPRHTYKLVFLAVAGMTFAVCTIPVWGVYAELGSWLFDLASHTKWHGEGATGAPSPTYLLENVAFYIKMAPGLLLSLALFGLLLVYRCARGPSSFWQHLPWRLFACLFLCSVCTILLSLKSMQARYLFIPWVLAGCMHALLLNALVQHTASRSRTILLAVLALFFVSHFLSSIRGYPHMTFVFKRHAKEQKALSTTLDTYADCLTVGHFRCPVPACGPAFGFLMASRKHAATLQTMYPNYYHYLPGTNGTVLDWQSHNATPYLQQAAAQGQCVVLLGPPLAPPGAPPEFSIIPTTSVYRSEAMEIRVSTP